MRRFVLGIAAAVTSLMPTIGMADDPQIADYIKGRLQSEQQQGNLRGFNVDMRVEQGTVWFKGHVSNSAQEMLILKAAQQAGHLGVVQVVDDIEVQGASASVPESQPQLQTASYQQAVQQAPFRQASSQEFVGGNQGTVTNGAPMPFANTGAQPPMTQMPMTQMPMTQAPMSYEGGGYSDGNCPAPMPMSYSSGGAPSEAPNLPGYAWPGYAAHPNYAAVSYPNQYSPSAWPYIGPFYPYPQVPLGWRKVTLEWDDGWWMLDFHDK